MALANLVRVASSTTGTGTLTLGSPVSGFLTPAQAGMVDEAVYSYAIEADYVASGDDMLPTSREVGSGTYDAGAGTLTRSVTNSTNGNTALNLTGDEQVIITALERDIHEQIGGRLSYVSTTSLQFVPLNGNLIQINGITYRIPTTGIAGLASATSVFRNGTAAQTLASNTLYYVYAFSNAGVITADFRTDGNGHIMSNTAGNEGVEVRCSAGTTRDDTRTLIGLIHTNTGSIQYVDTAAQRGVRSWLNDYGRTTLSSFTADRTTTSTSDPPNTELNSEIRNQIVLWSGETWHLFVSATVTGDTGDQGLQTAISIDGGTVEAAGRTKMTLASTAGARDSIAVNTVVAPSEGFHYATVMGSGDTGTKTWYGSTTRNTTLSGVTIRAGG